MDDEPDYLPPGPRAEPRETEVLDDWRKAEGGQARDLPVWPAASARWTTG